MKFNDLISINNKKIGRGNPVYIISEMACAHNGDFEQAVQLIKASAEAKADAVQLQFFVLEQNVTPTHVVCDILREIIFSEEQWRALFDLGKSLGLDVWACTYDVPSVKLAVKLGVDGIKLNSSDLSNPEIIESVALTKIPFTLGTGASTLEEISSCLHMAYNHGARNIILMHGVQNFPTEITDLNVSRISLLKNVFENMLVGYADHTNGDNPFSQIVDLVAVGLGVQLIEKHICVSRAAKGIDYQAALEPEEYKTFVENIRQAHSAYGSKELRGFSESDIKYRKFQKKSIVAARHISAGELIERKDVLFLRNEIPGLPPINFESKISGHKAKRSLTQYENINCEDII